MSNVIRIENSRKYTDSQRLMEYTIQAFYLFHLAFWSNISKHINTYIKKGI